MSYPHYPCTLACLPVLGAPITWQASDYQEPFFFFLYYRKSSIPNLVMCICLFVIHTALRKTKIGFTYFWQSRQMSPCPHTLGFTREYQALQEDNISCQYCASEFSGYLWILRLLSPIPQFLIQLALGTVWEFVSNKFSGRAAAAGPGAIPEKLFPGTGILTHLWKKSQLRLESVYLKCHRICLV